MTAALQASLGRTRAPALQMSENEMWCASVSSYMDKEAREPPLHISNKSTFGKTDRARSGDDEMV